MSEKDQNIIANACHAFVESNGRDGDVLRLSGCSWRLKVQNWRIFFEFTGDIITLEDVQRRSSKTYSKR